MTTRASQFPAQLVPGRMLLFPLQIRSLPPSEKLYGEKILQKYVVVVQHLLAPSQETDLNWT